MVKMSFARFLVIILIYLVSSKILYSVALLPILSNFGFRHNVYNIEVTAKFEFHSQVHK